MYIFFYNDSGIDHTTQMARIKLSANIRATRKLSLFRRAYHSNKFKKNRVWKFLNGRGFLCHNTKRQMQLHRLGNTGEGFLYYLEFPPPIRRILAGFILSLKIPRKKILDG